MLANKLDYVNTNRTYRNHARTCARSRCIPAEYATSNPLTANHMALIDNSTFVTWFFPQMNRIATANRNGMTAVSIRA